jgi:hypothetical protein
MSRIRPSRERTQSLLVFFSDLGAHYDVSGAPTGDTMFITDVQLTQVPAPRPGAGSLSWMALMLGGLAFGLARRRPRLAA